MDEMNADKPASTQKPWHPRILTQANTSRMGWVTWAMEVGGGGRRASGIAWGKEWGRAQERPSAQRASPHVELHTPPDACSSCPGRRPEASGASGRCRPTRASRDWGASGKDSRERVQGGSRAVDAHV